MRQYEVVTTARATIEERWTVIVPTTSDIEVTEENILELIEGAEQHDIRVKFDEDTVTGNEDNREVQSIRLVKTI